MHQDAPDFGPHSPDVSSPGRAKVKLFQPFASGTPDAVLQTLMDWMMITAWGLMAGLTACGVAAFEWLEARTAQRRRTARLQRPGSR